ncbi:O-antigen ligase family protein [Rouxiella badensis]|uniref:O-antigen ligase family protein n=1 Tax=Rouxiella badensis TaxID=1646377 RepID=UPI001B71FF95|nr:O-antigen ligase family protein [Rouxiella badensis]MCC3703429.1 hypothetical protein [Rouxiella badensis]MCC3718368.1 hypothetical protein [Rouxiella badensis]MCC3726864.1 hypothetical protein [Rouxiella badensis]MCC3731852.1 hypothetical protein [Rouxiella badensis]MCC3738787.1 hypothetical protein [Rouxiella badensis]
MFTINEPKKILSKIAIYLIMGRSFLCVPMIGLHLICDSRAMARFFKLVMPLALMIFIFAIYSLNNLNQMSNVIGQVRDMMLTFVVFGFLASIPASFGGEVLAYKALKNAAVFIAIAKIVILAIGAVTGISPLVIIKLISKVWDIHLMTLGVDDSFLTRLQIPIDSATPFLLYVLLSEILLSTQHRIRNNICFLLLLFSLLLTFSRFFWASGLMLMALSFIFNSKMQTKMTYLVIFMAVGYFLYAFTPLGDFADKIVGTRFGANVNSSSDIYRVVQTTALSERIWDDPIFGHGIGYYLPSLIRAKDTPYLYENQSLSMIMDLGFAGVVVFLLTLGMVIFGYCYNRIESRFINIALSLLFLALWITGGFFNPLLFGSSGGVILFFAARHHAIVDGFKEDTPNRV